MSNMAEWRCTSVVFDSPWLRVEAMEQVTPKSIKPIDGEPYYRVVDAPGVICVVLSSRGDFIMVRQHRAAIERTTLEFPAGRVEGGESPENAIRREVLEETGVHLGLLRLVGTAQPIPSRLQSHQSMYIGVAEDQTPEPVTEENTVRKLIPRKDFLATLLSEGMDCVVAIGAIKIAEMRFALDLLNDPMDKIVTLLSRAPDDLSGEGMRTV